MSDQWMWSLVQFYNQCLEVVQVCREGNLLEL